MAGVRWAPAAGHGQLMGVEITNPVLEAPIGLRLFGDFGIWIAGLDARPKSRKARGLLAFVAMAPERAVSRERIADLLWSDRGADQARGSLRQTLAEIRGGKLGADGSLLIGRDTIGFAMDRMATDRDILVEAAANLDAERLERQLEHIGPGFLDDLEGLSPGFDDWLLIERSRQRERLTAAVVAAVPAMLNRGHDLHLQAILRSLERLDPHNETVARLGMQIDHASGDVASLHRRYRRLTDELTREFGIRPSEETRSLFHGLTTVAPVEPLAPARPEPSVKAPPRPAMSAPPMVMVSPIVATDMLRENAEIAEACTDDIRNALARHPEIRVISLDRLDPERIESVCSGALAAYMLSGKLRHSEGEIRVNLQLGNIGSSIVVWSEQLRIAQPLLSDAIDRIVAKAVGAVGPAIDRDLAETLRQDDGDSGDTIRAYAHARSATRAARTLEGARAGVAQLEQIVERDPRHVGARLLLVQMYNTDFWQLLAGHDFASLRARALALMQEVAALEPGSARVQSRLAWCHLRRGEWDLAERRFRTAATANQFDADGINECAYGLCQLGALEDADQLMQRAFMLNPFPPPEYHADYAVLLALRGDARAAEEHFAASGETRMQYLAARLANSARLDWQALDRPALRDAFESAFAQAWQPRHAYTRQDVFDWAAYTFPLKMPQHVAFFREGLGPLLS